MKIEEKNSVMLIDFSRDKGASMKIYFNYITNIILYYHHFLSRDFLSTDQSDTLDGQSSRRSRSGWGFITRSVTEKFSGNLSVLSLEALSI